MNCVRFMSSTILYIFLAIQSVSHSQYYPYRRNSDYYDYHDDQDSSGSVLYPTEVTRENGHHFNQRNIEPPYRQHNHHYNYYNEPVSTGTTVRYFGTGNNAVPPKSVTTEKGSNEETNPNPHQPSADYRIRYNSRPTTPEPEFEYEPPQRNFYQPPPPPPPAPPPSSPPRSSSRSREISIIFDNEWQMNINIPDSSEGPDQGREVYRLNTNRNQRPRPRPQPSPTAERGRGIEIEGNNRRPNSVLDGYEEPPYAVVVVIDNRPTLTCPNSSYFLYRPNGRCYKLGTGDGPCGPLMKFYPDEENKFYGECDCALEAGSGARPLAYWKPHDRCYLLFQRGPCRYSEWLILDRDGYPHCASRSCPQGSDESGQSQDFWFKYKGKCYKTGRYYAALCTPGQEDYKVYFSVRNNKPQCFQKPPGRANNKDFLSPVIDLRCKPGYKKMQNGNCKRVAHYDYDY